MKKSLRLFLCQNSQYSCNIKRCSMNSPSVVEPVGDLNEKIWAQFATANDHGFYQVDTDTGAATYLGEIGENGVQLTGLFMMPTVPEIVDEIYVEGFTVPTWGEHPDYDLEVDPEAPYTLADVSWHWISDITDPIVAPEDFFDDESKAYYLGLKFSPKFGYKFTNQVTVYINGDHSLFDLGQVFGKDYLAYTIDFYVSDPAGVEEQSSERPAAWPNPSGNTLHLEGLDGEIVSVYDFTGRLVLQTRYENALDVSVLASGVYAVKVADHVMKFVKE